MKIIIISTGEEVLTGEIIDTNAPWLSNYLADQGLRVAARYTVGDALPELVESFLARSLEADIAIVTGGLGPTSDDLTAEAAAQAAGVPLKRQQAWIDELQQRYAKAGRVMDPQNERQADLPLGASLLPNPIGTACGFLLKINRCTFYFTPGVPHEFKKMCQEQIVPALAKQRTSTEVHQVRHFYCFGLTEAKIGRLCSAVNLPPTVTLGYRAERLGVEVKVIGPCTAALYAEIQAVLGDYVVSHEGLSLEETVHKLLSAGQHTLSTAESCSGGLLTSSLVALSGSSIYLTCGFVTYSNQAKTQALGVPAELINTQGAVSLEVARAMAEGAIAKTGSTYALAITGIAGPLGGSEEKPVGTVVFALATPTHCTVEQLRLPDWGRKRIRELSVAISLDRLRRALSGLSVLAPYDLTVLMKSEQFQR